MSEDNSNKEMVEFASSQEYQDYFSKKGFTLISDASTTDGLHMEHYSDESIHKVSVNFQNDKAELIEETLPLTTVDDYIKYFKAFDYKLVNDLEKNGSRNATLRMYSADDYGEIKIKTINDKVFLTKMINGKVIP